MDKVIVLKKTQEKYFREKEIVISELSLKILCISVPCKRKIKRKDKEKLLNIVSAYEKVFTDDAELFEFEKAVTQKTWLTFFLVEGLGRIYRQSSGEKIIVECADINNLLKETVLSLGERYRIVELCTENTDSVSEFVNSVYRSVGLPVNVKEHGEYEGRYIIKITDNITVLDRKINIEYNDLEIEYLYPLSKYNNLPLDKIIKAGMEQKLYTDLLQKGMVKIVGEISK